MFFLDNTTFKICKAVNFIGIYDRKEDEKSKGYMIALNSNEWFKLLKKGKCINLNFFYLKSKKIRKF